MGMFTNLFSKSYDPYELKGRWYKLTVSADKETGYLSVVKSDIPVFDEDDPAFGYFVEDNILFVTNGYVLDYTFMALSGGVNTGSLRWGNEVNPDSGAVSSVVADGINGAMFDLYLYIVKSNGIPNSGSGSDNSGSDDSGSDDHDIH